MKRGTGNLIAIHEVRKGDTVNLDGQDMTASEAKNLLRTHQRTQFNYGREFGVLFIKQVKN